MWVCYDEPKSKRVQRFFSKEKLPDAAVDKEGDLATVFWDLKPPIIIDLLENDATVNSTFYCKLFRRHYFTLFTEWPVCVCVCMYIYIYIYMCVFGEIVNKLIFLLIHCMCKLTSFWSTGNLFSEIYKKY